LVLVVQEVLLVRMEQMGQTQLLALLLPLKVAVLAVVLAVLVAKLEKMVVVAAAVPLLVVLVEL
jgi:hypothetical protein